MVLLPYSPAQDGPGKAGHGSGRRRGALGALCTPQTAGRCVGPPPPPRPWLGPKLAAPFNEDEIRASSSGRASIPAHSGLGLKIDSPSVWKAGGSGLRWRPRWGVEALQTLRLARLLPSGAPGSRTGACCKSKTPPPPAPAHSSLGSSPPLTAGDAFVKFKD